MNNNLSGLSAIHIELTSRCNKNCHMCGRRKVEKTLPDLADYSSDITLNLLKKISRQLPHNILVILHWNGEPTLYPRLRSSLRLFNNQITTFNTNGKLLLAKSDDIINNLDTLVLSTFEDDPEWESQFKVFQKFLYKKGNKKPNTIIRCLGNISEERMELYKSTGSIIAKRILHSPMGSFKYTNEPTIPEAGICLDFLNRVAINTKGEVSQCVRFDSNRAGIIGDINIQSLSEIWNGEIRMNYLDKHIRGKRNEIPLCKECEFWGVPRGGD